MRRSKVMTAVVLVTGLVLGWAASASAHVTVDPASAPKGAGDQVLTFRVPNEEASASTVKVEVKFPADHPIAVVDPLATPGWTVDVATTHLSTPIKTDDGSFSDVVSTITWSGGKIPPNQYGEFKVLAQGLPSDVSTLTFPTVQTYDDGKTASWIETTSDAEHPAPTLTLTAAADEKAAASSDASTEATAKATTTSTSTSSSDSSKGIAIAALVVGAIGIVVAGLALAAARKGSGPSAPAA